MYQTYLSLPCTFWAAIGLLLSMAAGCSQPNGEEVARFEKLGGKVTLDPDDKSVVKLSLRNTDVDDEDLQFVARLPKLQELLLNDTQVTDDGIKRLAGVSTLEVLDLSNT